MIGRVKHLERYGLANEVERNDVIKTVIRRALARWANVWVEKL
jgi:hypothetical protein